MTCTTCRRRKALKGSDLCKSCQEIALYEMPFDELRKLAYGKED